MSPPSFSIFKTLAPSNESRAPISSLRSRTGHAATPAYGFVPADVHLPKGTRVNGRYEVLSVLGEGGMGVVYHVRDELFPERELALKAIRHRAVTPTHLALF